jgi:hypothetical protein
MYNAQPAIERYANCYSSSVTVLNEMCGCICRLIKDLEVICSSRPLHLYHVPFFSLTVSPRILRACRRLPLERQVRRPSHPREREGTQKQYDPTCSQLTFTLTHSASIASKPASTVLVDVRYPTLLLRLHCIL